MRSAVVASLLLGACAGTNRFVPVDKIEHTDPARYSDDGAVIQQRDLELRVALNRFSERHYTRYAVLRSSGTSVAKIEVQLPPYGALAFLRARSVGPQGDVHVLAPKDLFRGTETSSTGTTKSWVRAQVPSVEVGSVVEIDYEVEYPQRLLTDDDLPLDDTFPIEKEHVSLIVDKRTSSSMFLYRASAPITQSDGADTHVSRFDLVDVPAYRVEPFAPPERRVRPRVGFHLSSAAGHARGSSWSTKLSAAAHGLYVHPDLPEDLVPPPSGADDVRAFLARATAFVADKTDLVKISYEEHARPLRAVLASRGATSTEKAVLLRTLLDRAHVAAHYAVVGHAPGDLDPNAPDIARFGHVLVTVLAQPGLDAITAIDPSCESCAVGELPSWTERATNAPVDAIEFWTENGVVQTAKLRLENGIVKPESVTRTWDLTLDADGAATLDVAVEEHGEAAVRQAMLMRVLDPKHRKEIATATVTSAYVDAKDVVVNELKYDKHAGRFTLRLRARIAGYATVSGSHMIVPLSVLPSRTTPRSNRPRRSVVYIAHDSSTHDRVTVHVPAGWSVDELPAARAHVAPGVQVSVEVESQDETVTVRQSLDLTASDYPSGAYAAVAQAIEDAAALHGESIVLTRK